MVIKKTVRYCQLHIFNIKIIFCNFSISYWRIIYFVTVSTAVRNPERHISWSVPLYTINSVYGFIYDVVNVGTTYLYPALFKLYTDTSVTQYNTEVLQALSAAWYQAIQGKSWASLGRIPNIWTDRPEQTVYTQIRVQLAVSLIWVYSVCCSSSNFYALKQVVKSAWQILGQQEWQRVKEFRMSIVRSYGVQHHENIPI